MRIIFHIFSLLLFLLLSSVSSLPRESESETYTDVNHIEEKPLMRIKRQSRKWKDIDCNDPDDHEQFDGCGADDVGKDKDEKWICPCRGCSRVINPKWTLKCGHGPEDHIDLTVKKGGCSANECWCVSAGGSTCSQADSPPGYPRTPGECIADHCYDRSTCAVHGYWCEGTEIYKKEKQIRKKIIQKDKDGDLDDIDCNDPDEDDQFDHCDEDDVGEDGDEKWICQCIYPQNEPVCTRVINPKWTMKCGHGDAKKKMFFGRKMKVILVR